MAASGPLTRVILKHSGRSEPWSPEPPGDWVTDRLVPAPALLLAALWPGDSPHFLGSVALGLPVGCGSPGWAGRWTQRWGCSLAPFALPSQDSSFRQGHPHHTEERGSHLPGAGGPGGNASWLL